MVVQLHDTCDRTDAVDAPCRDGSDMHTLESIYRLAHASRTRQTQRRRPACRHRSGNRGAVLHHSCKQTERIPAAGLPLPVLCTCRRVHASAPPMAGLGHGMAAVVSRGCRPGGRAGIRRSHRRRHFQPRLCRPGAADGGRSVVAAAAHAPGSVVSDMCGSNVHCLSWGRRSHDTERQKRRAAGT